MSRKQLNYSDQWDIERGASSLQEAKACLLYEYARESEIIVAWVDQHRKSPRSPDDFGAPAFSYLMNISVPLARMVAAMGRKASLSKPWYELKLTDRRKLAAAAYPSLRFAEKAEILKSLEKNPAWKSYRPFRDPHPIQSDQLTGRIMNLVVDVSLPTAEIVRQFGIFARNQIAPKQGGHRGRSATGLEPVKKQLKNLGLLRLLSNRDLTQARLVAQTVQSSTLLGKVGGEGGLNNRISGALATFRQLFPGLFQGEHPKMVSYLAYKKRHPGGRPSNESKREKRTVPPKGKPVRRKCTVLKRVESLMRNRAK